MNVIESLLEHMGMFNCLSLSVSLLFIYLCSVELRSLASIELINNDNDNDYYYYFMMQIELNLLVYCRTFKQQLICILIMHPTVRHTQVAYDEPELPNCAPGCRKSFKYQPQITTIKTNVLKNLLNATHTHTHTHWEHTHTHCLCVGPLNAFKTNPINVSAHKR